MSKRKKYDISPEFHHWMEARGYISHSFEYGSYWYGVSPKGRNLRAINGVLQIDDGDFDRWANSLLTEVDVPWTERDLDKALEKLHQP